LVIIGNIAFHRVEEIINRSSAKWNVIGSPVIVLLCCSCPRENLCGFHGDVAVIRTAHADCVQMGSSGP